MPSRIHSLKWRNKFINENQAVRGGGTHSRPLCLIIPPELVPRFCEKNTSYFGQFEHGIRAGCVACKEQGVCRCCQTVLGPLAAVLLPPVQAVFVQTMLR